MTAAKKLTLDQDAERALVKPFDETEAQESLVKLYGLHSTNVIPANEVPSEHDPAKRWKPNPRQELFLRNPTWELFYGGQGGGGKALALTTPIATPNGWTTMGALRVGDVVFDERGAPCTVLAATEPMFGHDVFDVVFDDGSVIRADAEHRWLTTTANEILDGSLGSVRTTQELYASIASGVRHVVDSWFKVVSAKANRIKLRESQKHRVRFIVDVKPVPTEPVRCIKVDSPSRLFLAGHKMIPTHNSDALLVDAMQFATGTHPQFGHLAQHHRALLLRRSYVDLVRYIIPRSQVLYPRVGGVWRASARRWHFPSGATIELGACDNVENIHRFAGAAYNWIGFDELTHFAESQYLFLLSRLRSASGLPTYYRSASNPGGPGHDWVLERFAPWLRLGDPDYEGLHGEYNKPLYFVRDESGDEIIVPKGTAMARGRSFIPATVYDNPFLATSEYIANMNAMSKLDRARIMHGDWLAKPGAGFIFEGKWFKCPGDGDPYRPTSTVARIRYWDLAGTEQARAKEGTAFTAGILMSAEVIGRGLDGTPLVRIWIEDIIRGQWHPAGVIKAIDEAMEDDLRRDPSCLTYIERDPGQAGAMQAWFMASMAGAKGHHLRPVPPQGSKIDRARIPSAFAEQGNVWILPAKWNKVFREELQSFPDGLKDQVDSFTGGFRQIMLLARNAGTLGSSRSTPAEHNPQKNIRKGGF